MGRRRATRRWPAEAEGVAPLMPCARTSSTTITTGHFATKTKRAFFYTSIAIALCLTKTCSPGISSTRSSWLAQDGDSLAPATDTGTSAPRRVSEFRANEALEFVRDWSSRFGRDVHYGTQEATCLRSIRDQYDPARRGTEHKASVVSIDWTQMHGDIVKTTNHTMGWHRSAVEAIARTSEYLAGNHTFDKKLTFDYIDVHRLHSFDEEGEEGEESLYQTEPVDGQSDSQSPSSGQQQQQPGSGSEESSFDSSGSTNQEAGQPMSDTDQSPVEALPKPSSSSPHGSHRGISRRQAVPASATTTIAPPQSVAATEAPGTGEPWQTPIKYLKLSRHRNFGDALINTDESAVHIPVHIFPGDPQVMNGIAWSEALNKVFRDNFVRNPRLTNQYFASQQGFMRLFPAQKWPIARADPDLYDARMRPWYVAGASSRKDVVILVDSSGSMTGSRRDIAKGVVFEILDTLTDNDHFLVLKFSDTIQQVGVPACPRMRLKRKGSNVPLKNTMFQRDFAQLDNETDVDSLFLVPATGRNVRHVKSNFTIPTSGIANFSRALVTALEVLRKYQDSETKLGSQCNQAIMLITDGSPSDFEEIFNQYNYPNAPFRVFTYLIGREAGDVTHTKMIACHNRGYYTHVINLAEVRETVQQYIPVMARPLVLNGSHPLTWTPAYGDLTYQILTDWIWESKRREKARAILRGSPDIRVSSSTAGDESSYLSSGAAGSSSSGSAYLPEDEANYEVALEEDLEQIDLFGYQSNTDCFWQTKRNDLLTTVVQPVYDRKNESVVTEKFLVKNVWTIKETVMRTAQILGVAAADMKINDIIALAPSHKLGANGYAILLTNNGYAMHHPNLRSILEPFTLDASERNMRILKPFFSSLDFTQVEHILNPASDGKFIALREEAVAGLTGWRELLTKRALDCQKRVQSRRQSFYYRPIDQFPFSFMIAIPQPYGSHRVEAQVEIKSASLPEKLTTYFTTSDYDLWSVHPDYRYCDGPSNNTITTLLDMFQRVETQKLDDVQWRPAESSTPPLFLPGKIVCDKDLVQSLVYDAFATFGFSDTCGPPSPNADPLSILLALLPRSSLLGMFGVRFSFVATRSGLTRVRHYDADDVTIKREALAFARKHARAIDETYYSRTVDYNMLVNESATLVQVPFNTFEKIREHLNNHETNQIFNTDTSGSLDSPIGTAGGGTEMTFMKRLDILTNSSLHVIATQSIIVHEGTQKAVAGVTGVFYDYASFVRRFLNSTNGLFQESGRPVTKSAACYTGTSTDESCDESKKVKCGLSNDTIDCLLIDNNGYIIVSEDLDFIGRHLKAYDPMIMNKLVGAGVYHEVNITDYQSVCMRQEEKQSASSAYHSLSSILRFRPERVVPSAVALIKNCISALSYSWTLLATLTLATGLGGSGQGALAAESLGVSRQQQQIQQQQALLPNKTYLRPCEKTLTLYETRPNGGNKQFAPDSPEYYTTNCGCEAWFVYEQVPKTNLIMLIVDTTPACRHGCDLPNSQLFDPTDPLDETIYATPNNTHAADRVCSILERESQLFRKKLDACYAHHPDEEQIKLCGAAAKSVPICNLVLIVMTFISLLFAHRI